MLRKPLCWEGEVETATVGHHGRVWTHCQLLEDELAGRETEGEETSQ